MGHGEWILVVDDEKAILGMVKATLESQGYRVLTAHGGADALQLFHEHAAKVRLVILDMMMPTIDGPVVMAEIRQSLPKLPIIAASGLRPTGRYAAAISAANARFLQKPYSDTELLSTMADLLRIT